MAKKKLYAMALALKIIIGERISRITNPKTLCIGTLSNPGRVNLLKIDMDF